MNSFEDGQKRIRIAEKRIVNLVVIVAEDRLPKRTILLRSLSRNQNRNDDSIPTLLVEVLQIQRIIPNLLLVIDKKRVGPDLEFDGKDNALHEEDHIDSFAQTWDGVFEQYLTILLQFGQHAFHDFILL